MLNESTKNSLKILGGVQDFTETIGSRKGIEFSFNNSLKSNYCKLIEYQDRYIIQLRKISTDPFTQEEKDRLVYESIIKEQEFNEVFEKETGIYLSMYLN
jgi:hypothetical protein